MNPLDPFFWRTATAVRPRVGDEVEHADGRRGVVNFEVGVSVVSVRWDDAKVTDHYYSVECLTFVRPPKGSLWKIT